MPFSFAFHFKKRPSKASHSSDDNTTSRRPSFLPIGTIGWHSDFPSKNILVIGTPPTKKNSVSGQLVLTQPFSLFYSPQQSLLRNGESHLPFSSAALISCAVAGVNYNSDVTHLSALGGKIDEHSCQQPSVIGHWRLLS